MTDDHQRARELLAQEYERDGIMHVPDCIRREAMLTEMEHRAIRAITAALRAAPEGWSFQRQDDGSIIVTAHGYGVVHVRPDDSDSIAAAMLHLLADDLAARPQGVKDRPSIDGCTESNCKRCRTHPNHRGDMEHAGIGWRPDRPQEASDA